MCNCSQAQTDMCHYGRHEQCTCKYTATDDRHVARVQEVDWRTKIPMPTVTTASVLQVMIQHDAMITSFRAEIMQKQDMHLATLHKDLERQMNFLDKMKSEVRHEMDKMSASQRLDLNLEKG